MFESQPRSIAGRLQRINPSCTFVVIAANWPSWLVSLIALGLPVQGAFFPARYHCYFKSKNPLSLWMPTLDLFQALVDCSAVYLVSGTVSFVRSLLPWFGERGLQRVIVSLEVQRREVSRSSLRSSRLVGNLFLREQNLHIVSFEDHTCGGATDAIHDFGFGTEVSRIGLPQSAVGLPLCVRHFLDGGDDKRFGG